MANNEFERWKSIIKDANKEARFWDYTVNGKRCLIVDGKWQIPHSSSYSVCTGNTFDKGYTVEGDIVVYPEVVSMLEKDFKQRSCPVVDIHKHLNQRHVHIYCKADRKKADRLIDYLKWF